MITQPLPLPSQAPTWTMSPFQPFIEPATVTQAFPPTESAIASPSPTFSPTETFTPTLEPQWSMQGPGDIVVPILLYHQIGFSPSGNIYYVSPYEFERQMFLLHEWGYTTISVELLVNAILHGAVLPPKPIILTFDDGNENAYSTAFPIMQKYNFTGTAYIVYNYVGATNFMNPDQIRELYNAGWEIGSHSLSHVDLTQHISRQETEIIESRRKLQALLDIPISTFAYPFGAYDDTSLYYVNYAGYLAGVGLGAGMRQGNGNLYYLYRRGIEASYDLKTFAQFLPWQGDLENLPALTLVP